MQEKLIQGVELALRSTAAPLVLGLRWAGRRAASELRGIPERRRGLGVASKAALDEFFFATELVSANLVPARDHARVVTEIRDAVALYEKEGWLDDPESFHRRPPPLKHTRHRDLRTPWLDYRHLRFESGYQPYPAEPGRRRWLSRTANHTAHAWLLEHGGPARPWIVCVPGYRMGHPLVDFTGFRVRWLHRRLGLNVAVPVMPLHGPRRVGRRGGDGFFTGDFVDTVHAQAQAVWDVRRLIGWLRARGAPAVGAYGVSLGGYTAALLAALERDLACVIAGIPATDFVRLLRDHAPPLMLRAAMRAGFSFEEVENLLRVVSPLVLRPAVPRRRRYVYAGVVDRLASPDHARDLWRHWGKPKVAWYQGGHVSYLWERDVKAFLEQALTESGLL